MLVGWCVLPQPALARAGFVDLQVENACDRYCVTAPDGERTEFPMFLVRGRKPVDAP